MFLLRVKVSLPSFLVLLPMFLFKRVRISSRFLVVRLVVEPMMVLWSSRRMAF